MKKYWRLEELDPGCYDPDKAGNVEKDGKYYCLTWGHDISTPGPGGITLFNLDVPGVVEANTEEEAREKLRI